MTNAVNGFFRGIVTAALNPLLDVLSVTLLTTPSPADLPRVGELWANSWQIVLACYSLLVLMAGILVMGYESVQVRYSVKEIAPRLVIGFVAAALSLWAASTAIELANALTVAVLGEHPDADAGGAVLRGLVLGSLGGPMWMVFIGVVLAAMLVVLLVSYVVRVALTLVLVAGAPVASMLYACPQTEGIARWYWKAFGGCLAIQVVQSLTLVTAIRVFLTPDGFMVFGPTPGGLVNLLVALALVYILVKIPFWVLGSLRGGGRSLLGSLVRGFLAYKTFGLLRGRSGRRGGDRTPGPPRGGDGGGGGGGPGGGGPGPVDPYARVGATAQGQYLLPLTGLRRTRPGSPHSTQPARPAQPVPRRRPQGWQLRLPLNEGQPQNRPVLERSGQYRLPLQVQRVTLDPAPAPPVATTTGSGAGGGRRRGAQRELPFDPYKGIRPNRSGQYRLPLDGVRRACAAPSPAATPPASASPPSGRPAARPARQRRLPLDLPKPARRTAEPARRTPAPAPQQTDPGGEA